VRAPFETYLTDQEISAEIMRTISVY
jgi:hypothetical protein